MSLSTSPPAVPALPGLHAAFIQQALPGWLGHAKPQDFARLHQAWRPQYQFPAHTTEQAKNDLARYLAQRRTSALALAGALSDLKGIAAFAEPLLNARLKREFGSTPDVNRVEFVQILREGMLFGTTLQIRPRRQSLLQAALQNFSVDADIDPASGLAPVDAFGLELLPGAENAYPRFRYVYRERLDISPLRFARVCHELDLGGRYQQHLAQVYEAPERRAEVAARWVAAYQDQLRVCTQVAAMRGEISASAQQMLLALAAGEPAPLLHGKPVQVSQLRLFEVPLAELLVISADRVGSDRLEPVVVYLPDAPLYPLKEYPSVQAARDDLRINLRLPAFQALLRRYLPGARHEHVFARLDAALYHNVEGRDGLYERQPNPDDALYLREERVSSELFAHVYAQHLDKLKADARVLAVPSAEADEQASEARRAYWDSIGFNLVNAAAFVIPALGAVMALVTAVQLVREVISGVEAWEHGELDQAWDHLSSVGVNLALMAGLSQTGHSAVPVSSSEVLDGLIKVELPDGRSRLWRPSLEPYRVAVGLDHLEADALGLYRAGDETYVRIDKRTYQVRDDGAGQWRMVHPSDPDGYQPLLVHNTRGAWRLQGENPLRWEGLTLWRRLGPCVEGLSDEDLRRLAQATGTSDACLRRVHLDREPLPAALEETLHRWQLHRRVGESIAQLRVGQALPAGQHSLPLQLLTQMPAWPGDLCVQLHEDGQVLGEWGNRAAQAPRLLRLSPAQLADGSYRQQLLGLLSDNEQKGLIGAYLESTTEARGRQLQQATGRFAAEHPAHVFDLLHAAEPLPDVPGLSPLRRDFPGLPWRLGRALVGRANSLELEQLLATPPRVPLRLAEEARWLLEDVALNQACEGLYFAYQESPESLRLALGQLQQLDGWSASLELQVRELNWRGALLDSIGEAGATKKYLLRRGAGYQALDEAGDELGGVESLYAAILHALPDSERAALGLAIDQPDVLRQRLAEAASADRVGARRLLRQRPRNAWFKPPLRLEDGQLGYPLSGRGDGAALRSPALLERVRLLYPDLSLAETNALLDDSGVEEAQLGRWLEDKHLELNTLLEGLDNWVDTFNWEPDGPQRSRLVPAEARRNAAQIIERCWRRQSERVFARDGHAIGYRLDLSSQRFVELPPLVGDFSHVGALHLNDCGLTELPARFLQVFTRLRWLSVARNRLDRVPEALAELTGLTKLLLPGNAIVLDGDGIARLARLRQLKILQLDYNPLGQLPDLSRFEALRGLLLRRTGLRDWPAGVFELAHVEWLDLRDNLISHVPPQVLEPMPAHVEAVTRVNRATSLSGNPLNEDSLARLGHYYERTGISLGAGHAGGARRVPAVVPADQAVALWVDGDADALHPLRRAKWQQLHQEPDSAAFFHVLDDLRLSADFRRALPELRARVWAVLDAAVEDTELRGQLFEAAANPDTCSDGATLIFSQLEVLVLVRQALAAPSVEGTERSLLQLARGLMRLERVESIALSDIAKRRLSGESPDEVEVRLAYRLGLAEALELPGQAQHMNFAGVARVSKAQLDAAKAAVLAAETPAALKQTCVDRPFWASFLKKRFAERFERVDKPYYARLEALEKDKEGMTDQVFKQQIERINTRRRAEERRLLENLTVELWNALPGQTLKLVP
ncbi:hypothetical protein DCO48_08185 [Pseudomonas sp. SDI]|uniref:NEL-type E3 ubiquitin ligase domain-containing protein n=1 Tax=Pseudomonas sp. SDI TaxID=2170734 RepID=UPI000DE60FB6|nr:NEL-type E3 ubiquitin ligase domain-containing protein [Pseudomonas sp. SDI]PWB33948.1 hypothetical protein DCO48_08185 [Pseudomonas sp. SDI]